MNERGGAVLDIWSRMAPFESRLLWERRELAAADLQERAGMIVSVLEDLGFCVRQEPWGLSAVRKGEGPVVACSLFDEKGSRNSSASAAILLVCARLMAEEELPGVLVFSFGDKLPMDKMVTKCAWIRVSSVRHAGEAVLLHAQTWPGIERLLEDARAAGIGICRIDPEKGADEEPMEMIIGLCPTNGTPGAMDEYALPAGACAVALLLDMESKAVC